LKSTKAKWIQWCSDIEVHVEATPLETAGLALLSEGRTTQQIGRKLKEKEQIPLSA